MTSPRLALPRIDLASSANDLLRNVANGTFLLAVVAANFTLMRPSPVDILIILTLGLAVLSGQIMTTNIVVFLVAIASWLLSLYASSLWEIDDPEATFLVIKITYALSIAVCSALIAAHWRREDLQRFIAIFVLSSFVAACLGILGIATGSEDLTWDGRASGLFDDPNMYGSFLLTGLISCMYKLQRGRHRLIYGPVMAVLLLGLVLSFSRAAIVSFMLWGGLFYLFINLRNLPRALFFLFAAAVVALCVLAIGALIEPDLAAKFADRTTIAKPYDLGHDGRYNRYLLSVEMILQNPMGLGVLVLHRLFDEPIHNIWLSSFVNYGWIAGFAYTFLIIFTVVVSLRNYRALREPMLIVLLLGWVAVQFCAILHEAERWRHLWMLFGLIWGLNLKRLASQPPEPARAPSRAVPAAA